MINVRACMQGWSIGQGGPAQGLHLDGAISSCIFEILTLSLSHPAGGILELDDANEMREEGCLCIVDDALERHQYYIICMGWSGQKH